MAPPHLDRPRVRIYSRRLRKTPSPMLLSTCLQSHGLAADESMDERLDPGKTDVVWIQGTPNWSPMIMRSLRAMRPEDRPYVIIWQTEPLPLPRAAGVRAPLPTLREFAKMVLRDSRATDLRTNARVLRELAADGIPNLVVVSTKSRALYLAEQGIESHFVPYGYTGVHGRDLGLERNIQALFVGILTDPRYRRAIRRVRTRGIDLVAAGDWERSRGLWGLNRTETINRAKTFLALQRHPGELSGLRMILGMCNGSLVISEPIVYPEPYVPGVHYVSSTLEDMPDVIGYYLANESERTRIAEAGRNFVTTELTYERSVKRVLELAGLA